MASSKSNWTKSSWKKLVALQQPKWPDQNEVEKVLSALAQLPPLVFAGEIRSLKAMLAKAAKGEAFLLQGGDCSEDFSQLTAPKIRETLKVLLQMAVILTYAGGKPVIKVGRIAGQFAKPRSSDTEKVNDIDIPSYRGAMVNRPEQTLEARVPNPKYMLQAYNMSASTLNLLRASPEVVLQL
jgi:3-deoxy-7-phosphoheptulonate synthase